MPVDGAPESDQLTVVNFRLDASEMPVTGVTRS